MNFSKRLLLCNLLTIEPSGGRSPNHYVSLLPWSETQRRDNSQRNWTSRDSKTLTASSSTTCGSSSFMSCDVQEPQPIVLFWLWPAPSKRHRSSLVIRLNTELPVYCILVLRCMGTQRCRTARSFAVYLTGHGETDVDKMSFFLHKINILVRYKKNCDLKHSFDSYWYRSAHSQVNHTAQYHIYQCFSPLSTKHTWNLQWEVRDHRPLCDVGKESGSCTSRRRVAALTVDPLLLKDRPSVTAAVAAAGGGRAAVVLVVPNSSNNGSTGHYDNVNDVWFSILLSLLYYLRLFHTIWGNVANTEQDSFMVTRVLQKCDDLICPCAFAAGLLLSRNSYFFTTFTSSQYVTTSQYKMTFSMTLSGPPSCGQKW